MERPIGIIDSGVGGLTVMQEITKQLPRENLIYLGDIARCPYGSRTKKEIKRFTCEMVNFLLEKNIKLLVIACNTATAHTLNELEKSLDIPVMGVIQPGSRTAIKHSEDQNIAVIGTESTIRSQRYVYELKKINPNVRVSSVACPTFVPMIEKGAFEGPKVEREIHRKLYKIKKQNIDTLILGCTHYPLIKDAIQNELGTQIKIVSSGEETAREVSAILKLNNLTNLNNSKPHFQFYTTGDSELFIELTERLFEFYIDDIKAINIEKVTI